MLCRSNFFVLFIEEPIYHCTLALNYIFNVQTKIQGRVHMFTFLTGREILTNCDTSMKIGSLRVDLTFAEEHGKRLSFHFHFIFNFSGMVAPQLKKNCFTGGHAFKYSKNLIDNLQLINTIKKIKFKRKSSWFM